MLISTAYKYISENLSIREYDLIATEYYDKRHITSRNFDLVTANFLQSRDFQFPSSGLVLDLGSGRGTAGRFLNVDPSRVIQADCSQKMLSLTNREPSLERVLCKAPDLPFAEESFQSVCAFLFDPYFKPELFEAIAKVLKPGGVFFGTLPSKTWGDTIRQLRGYSLDVARFLTIDGKHIECRSKLAHPIEISNHLARAGFVDIKIEEIPLPENVHEFSVISPDISDAAAFLGVKINDFPIVSMIFART